MGKTSELWWLRDRLKAASGTLATLNRDDPLHTHLKLNVFAPAVVDVSVRRCNLPERSGRELIVARLISQCPSPGVPGSAVTNGGPPCA
jgi:hypothetical protein